MYFKDLPVNSFTEAIDLMTAGGKITGEFIVAIEGSKFSSTRRGRGVLLKH